MQKSTRHILTWSELKLAVFISTVIVLVVFTIFFSGLVSALLSQNISLVITISDVGGLKVGAPVWLQGVTVGNVRKIDVLSKSQIIMVQINKKYQPFLYGDAHAEVKAVGLLGSKYVEIIRGTQSSGPIKPNQKIVGRLVDPLKSMDENLSSTIKRLSALIDSINRGEGTAGAIVNDSSLAADLKGTMENLRMLIEQMRKSPKEFFKVEIF
ncbi:MAG TPA: MlaD family protein [Chitinispirillaceae bacterium]|nr:MlaD family protein [Chitinispirillaceae bacterium]